MRFKFINPLTKKMKFITTTQSSVNLKLYYNFLKSFPLTGSKTLSMIFSKYLRFLLAHNQGINQTKLTNLDLLVSRIGPQYKLQSKTSPSLFQLVTLSFCIVKAEENDDSFETVDDTNKKVDLVLKNEQESDDGPLNQNEADEKKNLSETNTDRVFNEVVNHPELIKNDQIDVSEKIAKCGAPDKEPDLESLPANLSEATSMQELQSLENHDLQNAQGKSDSDKEKGSKDLYKEPNATNTGNNTCAKDQQLGNIYNTSEHLSSKLDSEIVLPGGSEYLVALKDVSPKEKRKEARLVALLDASFARDDVSEACQLLLDHKAEETDNPELLWRYARTLYERSKLFDVEESRCRDSVNLALTFASRAVAGGPNVAEAHLWLALCLEASGKWKRIDEKIKDSFIVKEHLDMALQCNPQSEVVLHSLGSWCLTAASFSWVERRFAQLLFLDLPQSTYEEALGFFRAAEEVAPHSYSLNLLFIAKCYAKLKDEDKTTEFLELVVDFVPRDDDDRQAIQEAKNMLRDRFI